MASNKRRQGWDDKNYVKVYELRRTGANSLAAVAGPMGCKPETLKEWLANDPALKDAWEKGGDARGANGKATLHEYIFGHLPPQLQAAWEEINDVENKENHLRRCDAMFADMGKRARQHLFLYSFVEGNFNPSAACAKVGISKSTLDVWCEDPIFVELIKEIDWHKKNFAEGCLFNLASSGDSPATIFLNKSLNKDRGYDPKTHVVHEGTVKHEHVLMDITQLGLPIDIVRIVLEAYRNKTTGIGGDVPALPGAVVGGGEEFDPTILEGEFVESDPYLEGILAHGDEVEEEMVDEIVIEEIVE